MYHIRFMQYTDYLEFMWPDSSSTACAPLFISYCLQLIIKQWLIEQDNVERAVDVFQLNMYILQRCELLSNGLSRKTQ